jgi:hypothetical protein
MTTTCPLCAARKPKRVCPALERQICAVCCGTKRITEISCPPTCGYLSSARAHPPAVVQRRQERDLRFFLPLLSELSEAQYRLLLFLQGITLEHSASALPPLLDSDVAEAASTVAATLETAGKGIIYQHQAASLPAQRLVTAIEAALQRLAAGAGSRQQALERDAAVALRQLARAATEAGRALPGDEPPVFLKLLGRIMATPEADSAAQGDSGEPSDTKPDRRLVIPG